MKNRIQTLIGLGALAAALTLGACGREPEDDLASLDNELVGNEADPALTSALQDQVLTDPGLAQQSNRNAVRPAERPVQAQYPAGAGMGAGGCAAGTFDYAAGWADRLPQPFAVYPGGRVTEAAANNANGCRMRVVTFASGEAPQRLLNWYQARAESAGYSAERQNRDGDLILAGTQSGSEAAYFLIVTPRARGAEVALITNNGV